MKHCHRCNLDFSDEHVFCKACGGRLTVVAPQTGRQRAVYCPKCAAQVQPGWRFCKKCRAEIAPTAVARTESSVYTPPVTAVSSSLPSPPIAIASSAPNGQERLTRCPYCRNEIEQDARFCEFCGRKIIDDGRLSTPHSMVETPADVMTARPVAHGREDTDAARPTTPLNHYQSISAAGGADSFEQADENHHADFALLDEYSKPAIPFWQNWIFWTISGALLLLLAGAGTGIWYVRVRKERTVAAQPPASTPSPQPSVMQKPSPPEGMVYVPGGTFSMGRDDGDEYERPAHEVLVKPFFMDQYEVTSEDYQKFIDATGYPAPQGWVGGKYPEGAARFPVTGVSWTDANAYAQWADKRLPTEDEWEFAARGPASLLYPWGNDWNPNAANLLESGKGKVVDVGSYPEGASPYGIHDMLGNAWEWTASQLQSYSGGSIRQDSLPDDQRRNLKVIRGGCYLNSGKQAMATYRNGWWAQGAKYEQTGFRCVKDVR
jgi:formylglycine-generating enzyme required for sulfatase activity